MVTEDVLAWEIFKIFTRKVDKNTLNVLYREFIEIST